MKRGTTTMHKAYANMLDGLLFISKSVWLVGV
jgi:hypothetical protein